MHLRADASCRSLLPSAPGGIGHALRLVFRPLLPLFRFIFPSRNLLQFFRVIRREHSYLLAALNAVPLVNGKEIAYIVLAGRAKTFVALEVAPKRQRQGILLLSSRPHLVRKRTVIASRISFVCGKNHPLIRMRGRQPIPQAKAQGLSFERVEKHFRRTAMIHHSGAPGRRRRLRTRLLAVFENVRLGRIELPTFPM